MARRRQIYEGKAKILYEGPEPGTLIQYFKDDATAFNAQKKGTINGKGVINNRISEHIFTSLATIGVPTHFIRRVNMREQLIRQCEIVPIEVVVRNVAAKPLCRIAAPGNTLLSHLPPREEQEQQSRARTDRGEPDRGPEAGILRYEPH